jgi:hypothetical protein
MVAVDGDRAFVAHAPLAADLLVELVLAPPDNPAQALKLTADLDAAEPGAVERRDARPGGAGRRGRGRLVDAVADRFELVEQRARRRVLRDRVVCRLGRRAQRLELGG